MCGQIGVMVICCYFYYSIIEDDLCTVVEWGEKWLVTFNAAKTKLLSINRYREPFLPPIYMNRTKIPGSSNFCLLGLCFFNDLSWKDYIQSIAKSATMKVGSRYRSIKYLTPESILYFYTSTICPCFEYCCHIWAWCSFC